ncbi:MAG: hypothetical protein ACOC97_01445 [Myxococcota bacterium]
MTEAEMEAYAQDWSDDLEAFIYDWLDGKNDGRIPDELLPPGVKQTRNGQSAFEDFYLVAPEDVPKTSKWGVTPALKKPNLQRMEPNFRDSHATYVVSKPIIAPFGTTVEIDGEFPHSRFFSIEALPPYDPYEYTAEGGVGGAETGVVDIDIEPEPGHVNPFRIGSDPNATDRSYSFEVELAMGPTASFPTAYGPPYWRRPPGAPANKLVSSGILYQGPAADEVDLWGNEDGRFKSGHIWMRYYAIPDEYDALAGVDLPDMRYRLPTGETFYVAMDFSGQDQEYEDNILSTDTANAIPTDPPEWHADWGWDKMFGIFNEFAEAFARDQFNETPEYVRELDRGYTGRGEDEPGARSWETGSTKSNFINYLAQKFAHLGDGRITVLTGKLPETPKTRNGPGEGAEARYFSITGYTWELDADARVGNLVGSFMDDELVVDSEGRYTLVVSQTEDRPANATPENGVTWLDAGNERYLTFVIRWLSVHPDWHFSQAPTEDYLTWSETTWSGKRYDPTKIGQNVRTGALGPYLPKHNFMDKSCFERLGQNVTWADVDGVPWGSKWCFW